ncbi:hypothetical protein BZG36_05185, partial [Bifiguratus adelaidae]
MWLLQGVEALAGIRIYLLPEQTISIGRKGCEIIVPQDMSVSRKHASITVGSNPVEYVGKLDARCSVTVEDHASKYGTRVKDKRIETCELQQGDIIALGTQKSQFRLDWHPMVIGYSALKESALDKLQRLAMKLDFKISRDWKPGVMTHLYMQQIEPTSKVIQALVDMVPLVNEEWLDVLDGSLSANSTHAVIPSPEAYMPPVAPDPHHEHLPITYDPRPQRKSLFKGKTFVFFGEPKRKEIKSIITHASGQLLDFSPTGATNADTIIQQLSTYSEPNIIRPPTTQLSAVDWEDLCEAVTLLRARMIDEEEVSYAILVTSTKTFCNPRAKQPAITSASAHNPAISTESVDASLPFDLLSTAPPTTRRLLPFGKAAKLTTPSKKTLISSNSILSDVLGDPQGPRVQEELAPVAKMASSDALASLLKRRAASSEVGFSQTSETPSKVSQRSKALELFFAQDDDDAMQDDKDGEPETTEGAETGRAPDAKVRKESQDSNAAESLKTFNLEQKRPLQEVQDVEMKDAPAKKRGRGLVLREADEKVAQKIAEEVTLEKKEASRKEEESRKMEMAKHVDEFGEDEQKIHNVTVILTCPLVKSSETQAQTPRRARKAYTGPNFKRFKKTQNVRLEEPLGFIRLVPYVRGDLDELDESMEEDPAPIPSRTVVWDADIDDMDDATPTTRRPAERPNRPTINASPAPKARYNQAPPSSQLEGSSPPDNRYKLRTTASFRIMARQDTLVNAYMYKFCKVAKCTNFGTLVADEGKSESVKEFETRILELVDQFTRPPFTIQRLCELTVNPTLYHRTLPKYLRALEKILLVTSSSEDFTETKQDDALSNGHLPDALDNGVVMQPINEMSSEGLTNSLITSTMDINTAPALQLITFNHSGEHLSLHTSEDKTDESVHGPTAADAMDLASADTQHEPEAGAAKDA